MKNNNIERSRNTSSVSQEGSFREPKTPPRFILVAEERTADSKDMNMVELIRSIYEGTSTPEDFTLNIEEIHEGHDASFKEHSLLHSSLESGSVQMACNAAVIDARVIEVPNVTQTDMMNGDFHDKS